MYDNLRSYSVGDFLSQEYWSSSEYNSGNAWYQDFNGGTQTYGGKTGSSFHVRAMRSFTADAASYDLRDAGPSGGWIFYKSGSSGTVTFYEAAPVDQEDSLWSNVGFPNLIGTTGTAINTGLANTNAIVGQAGHTSSGAQLCLDYSCLH